MGKIKRLYKVLNEDGSACWGGSGKWYIPTNGRPGRWMPAIKNPIPCEKGYHLLEFDQLIPWLGPAIWMAEGRGARVEQDDKSVWEEARLISRVTLWNEQIATLFACDCAQRVLHLFENECPNDDRVRNAIKIARNIGLGESSRATRAAVAAARDAAWDAVAAAGTARDAGDAARAAAGAAAGAAARDAEHKWQYDRLAQYLRVER